MKTLSSLVFAAFVLSSCTNYYTEEVRYDYRERMTGYYDVEEYSDTYNEEVHYSIYVSKNPATHDGIYLQDFYAYGVRVSAYIDNDYIDIPFQVVNGFEIEGSGSFYGGELHLNYSVRDRRSNAPTDYCDTIAYRD